MGLRRRFKFLLFFLSFSSRLNMMFCWVHRITFIKFTALRKLRAKTDQMDVRRQRKRTNFGQSQSCRWSATTTRKTIQEIHFISIWIRYSRGVSSIITISTCRALHRTRKRFSICNYTNVCLNLLQSLAPFRIAS